jgi:hypothetical protein
MMVQQIETKDLQSQVRSGSGSLHTPSRLCDLCLKEWLGWYAILLDLSAMSTVAMTRLLCDVMTSVVVCHGQSLSQDLVWHVWYGFRITAISFVA